MGKHLDRLESMEGRSGCVVYIEKEADGTTFKIWDGCDHYFSEDFTADELRELGQEIIEMAGQ